MGAHHRVAGGKTTTVSDRERVSPQGRQFDLGKQQRFSCAGHREGTAIHNGAVRGHYRAQARGASSSTKRGVSGGGAETSQDGQLGLWPCRREVSLLVRRNATNLWTRSSNKQASK